MLLTVYLSLNKTKAKKSFAYFSNLFPGEKKGTAPQFSIVRALSTDLKVRTTLYSKQTVLYVRTAQRLSF